MRRFSIRGELTKSSIALVMMLWILGVFIAGASVHHEASEIFDSALRETADHLVPVVRELRDWKAARKTIPADTADYVASRGQVHYIVRSSDGDFILASKGAPIDPQLIPLKAGFFDAGNVRSYARFLQAEGLWIIVVQEMRERNEASQEFLIGLALPLLALIPFVALGIHWSVRRATKPLDVMARELEARGSNDLTAIDERGLPAELGPIGLAINKLMQRLKAALEAERAFSANAAHELRNPIAGARAQLELLADDLRGSGGSERIQDVVSQLDRLGRRAEKLLQVSRAEAGAGQSGDVADLATVVTLICDEFQRITHVAQRLRLEFDDEAHFAVAMDMDALAIVLRNAIENAVLHGASAAPIIVRIDADQSLHVINECVAISAGRLEQLKQRFRRGAPENIRGSGLGLTIIETIMRQAGGRVELHSPAINSASGFELVLIFPMTE